jgi:hypothetical protein
LSANHPCLNMPPSRATGQFMHGNAKQPVLVEGHRPYHLAGDKKRDDGRRS